MKKYYKKRNNKKLVIVILTCIAVAYIMSTNIEVVASETNGSDYGLLVETLKDELRNGNLSNEEEVRNAIDKAEEKYGMNISDSDEEKIVKLVGVAEDMGIDGEKMADIVDDVYDKAIDGQTYSNTEEMIKAVENQMIDSATDAVKEVVVNNVKNSISDYFRDFVERIKSFWSELMSKWKIS